MKIYTKTGDKGTTGLIGGARVSKDSPRIASYGEVDELNALIGLARSVSKFDPVRASLLEIQNHLFIVGAHLASPQGDPKVERITSHHVEILERQIDVMDQTVKPLKHFVLPGGTETSALLHMARTVCRRAERSVVHLATLNNDGGVDSWILIYLNRLSDYLFTAARLANQIEGVDDIPWLPTKSPT